jgi:hypothetical protein
VSYSEDKDKIFYKVSGELKLFNNFNLPASLMYGSGTGNRTPV